jgi:hypothetical protein
MTLTESPHLPDTCLIRAFRRMSVPSSTSRLRRASHTFGLGHQPPLAIDHCHLAAESPRRLGHLHSDVAPPTTSKCSGISSSSRASICVSGCASARPGIIFSAARVPVLTITFAPRSWRVVPSGRVTSTVLGARNRPVPNMTRPPCSCNKVRWRGMEQPRIPHAWDRPHRPQ